MASEGLVLDPTSEDAANIQLALENAGSGIAVMSQDFPAPGRRTKTAPSADTFGDPLVSSAYGNRTITLVVRCFGSESTMRARVADLTQKAGKLAQYGGTLKRTLNNGDVVIFDVLDADIDVPADWQFLHANNVNVTLTLTAKPAGRGPEESFSSVSETTLPAVVFTVTGVKGDIPGLGRLVLDEQDGDDQQFAQFGLQCRNYPGATAGTTTAHLFYQAEALTPLSGAAGSALAGASGGTVVNQGTLTASMAGILGLRLSGGSFLSHVGDFSVWARMYVPTSNSGTVSCALEWAQGDLRNVTRNTEQTFDTTQRGSFQYVPLGQVHLAKVRQGAQRWDAQIVAKSNVATDDVAVDCLYLFPVTEGYGEIRGSRSLPSPSTFTARDDFAQAGGNLNGTVLPAGGTWATSGATTDYVLTGGGAVTRTKVSDAGPRFALAGTAQPSTLASEVTVSVDAINAVTGLVARYVNASNYLYASITVSTGIKTLTGIVVKVVGGSPVTLAVFGNDTGVINTAYRLQLTVTASGAWTMYVNDVKMVEGSDEVLAVGGVLASGRFGLYDQKSSATACTRTYDNFLSWTPALDAAIFANQSLEIGPHSVIREDAGGSVWADPGSFRGRYPRIPPSNVGGTVRVIAKASRNVPGEGPDSAIDDLQGTLHYTPLYLSVPE